MKTLRYHSTYWLTLLLLLAGTGTVADDFPGRTLYPTVTVVETEELHQRFDQVTIVDVRSTFEYETLHIKGAVHIPLARQGELVEKVIKLHEEGKPLVFYCNGRACENAYRAVLEAERAGVAGTAAFDAGVLDWARAYPDKAVLLGEPLGDAAKLITQARFEARLLEPAEFASRMGRNGRAIDARDRFQRDAVGLFVGRERWVPFDDRAQWQQLAAEAKSSGEPLFIYDAVGRQVQWLQYSLEQLGVKEYYFMKGGARGFYESLR